MPGPGDYINTQTVVNANNPYAMNFETSISRNGPP
jgi:hypothetical protein